MASGLYLATLDCATSNPSLSSSPWMRGAPTVGSRCSFAGSAHEGPFNLRPPSPWARFPTPIVAKAGPMPPHERLRLNNCDDLQNRREPSIQLDKKPAVVVPQPDPALNLTPQYYQLMSERRILCLKPALRLEWRGQDGQDEAEQSEHRPLTLGDSVSYSMWMRFSVHTGICMRMLPTEASISKRLDRPLA